MLLTFFDVESQHTYQELGLFNKQDKIPSNLKMAIGGILVHDTENSTDKHYFFNETQALLMIDMLKKSELIIGHNIIRFDYKLIQQYTNENINHILMNNTFDTLIELEAITGIWTSLDDLCKRNLGKGKNEDSSKIPEMFRNGEFQRVQEYLRNDLNKTRDIYLYIKKNKRVKFMMKDYGVELGEREVEVVW